MKTAIIILLFLGGSAFCQVAAQVTAVMEVRAKVISGAGLTSVDEADLNLQSSAFSSEGVDAGSFGLVAAPGTDINIHLEDDPVFTNQYGEIMQFNSLSFIRKTSASGNHEVTLNGKFSNQQQFNGQYKGKVTAVVEYL